MADIPLTPSRDVEMDPEGSRYSKAMAKLIPAHRRFVEALFNQQKRDYAEAYIVAYGKVDPTEPADKRVAIVSGSRIAHRDDVQEAIYAEGARRMTAYVPAIMEMLANIAGDPSHKDCARVGLGILDRTGHGPTSKSEQNIIVSGGVESNLKIDITSPQTAVAVRKFAEFFHMNGDDLARHLGTELAKKALPAPPVVEAEFTEVVEEIDWTMP